jgi:hypothetical protein
MYRQYLCVLYILQKISSTLVSWRLKLESFYMMLKFWDQSRDLSIWIVQLDHWGLTTTMINQKGIKSAASVNLCSDSSG